MSEKYVKPHWFSLDEDSGLYYIPKGISERVSVFVDRIHLRLRQGAAGGVSQYVLELLYALDIRLTADRHMYDLKLLNLPVDKTYEDLKLWAVEWGDYFCNPWSHYPAPKLYKTLLKTGYRSFHKSTLEYGIAEIKLTWEAEDERQARDWYAAHPERDPGNTELFGKKRKRGRASSKLNGGTAPKNATGS